MGVMLDSNACIFIMKRDQRIKPKARLSECGISQIVLGELEYGVCNSPKNRQQVNRQALYDFLSAVRIHPISNDVTALYGEVRALLRRQGQPIGPNDLWIAAHALALDTTLVTNNTREFTRVPNLVVDNWIIESGHLP